MDTNFNVVLFEPEIPQNTGNIVRLCVCTGCRLFLVGKLGFTVSDKYLKRAGLDYWNDADIQRFNTLEELQAEYASSNFYYCTTKTKTKYTDRQFQKGDFFVFGPESRGLSEDLLKSNSDKCITIPMAEGQRSLNLSNSVSIVVYEAVRQNGCL
ncbi:tRNA (cytidine(34)-2'-O)-methyltransferase [bacterium]|nr:tRNA (cytidine(34)-2'-O)-methyltransferase [bacterium]